MQAEIIAVGTEILLGQITDTNSPLVARLLATLDIDTYYQTVVGDNHERLLSALTIASKRADLIITIGGLGPTPDDLTKQTVSEFVKQTLIEDQPALDKILDYHQRTQRPMSVNNRLQALYMADGQPLLNENGFAVGCFYQNPNGPDVLLLPGPPWELEPMLVKHALPVLAENYQQSGVLFSRVLRFYGIGESRLVTQLANLIENQTNPTVAPYAKAHEVTLRITAQAKTTDAAIKLIDEMEADIMAEVGDYFYGYGDDFSLEECVGDLLINSNLHITAAESMTSGLFQSTLGKVAGISQVFDGGLVTYSPATKIALLDVDPEVIEEHGVVSEATACAMAVGAQKKLGADIAISFTGVASGELEGHEAGTVWVGIAFEDDPVQAFLYHFGTERQKNRERAVMAGLDLIRRTILGLPIVEYK